MGHCVPKLIHKSQRQDTSRTNYSMVQDIFLFLNFLTQELRRLKYLNRIHPTLNKQVGALPSSPLSAPNMLINSLICQTFSVYYMSGIRAAEIRRLPQTSRCFGLMGKINGHIFSQKPTTIKQRNSECQRKRLLNSLS